MSTRAVKGADGFGFSVCYAATQLAIQVQQERIQFLRSNRVVRKRPAESNGTPAMDTGHINIDFDVYIIVKKTFAYADIQTNEE